MKTPLPMPADQILMSEMSKSVVNTDMTSYIKPPGSNPWIKYIIVGGVIVLAGVLAYQLTKQKDYGEESDKRDN